MKYRVATLTLLLLLICCTPQTSAYSTIHPDELLTWCDIAHIIFYYAPREIAIKACACFIQCLITTAPEHIAQFGSMHGG